MNSMGISTDPALLSVDLPTSLTESASVSTFLAEEDVSTCPLLPNTPSPPPMAFSHPLTPGADNGSNDSVNCEDTKAETSSSGSSSGIGMDVTETATTSLFGHQNAYQHLGKNGDIALQEKGLKQNGILNISITKETPNFVSWNWPFIRKCTFFVFMSSLLAMCAIVVALIITLPRICNPKTSWYKGSVFYEIFPASFQDSNNDGVGDLRGIASRAEYLEEMGIAAVRLNSIFPSKDYPDHYQNITSLTEIDEALGSLTDFEYMMNVLHMKNISLILDLPIYPYLDHLGIAEIVNASVGNDTFVVTTKSSLDSSNIITQAMRFWLARGVDGFYVKGLENFVYDQNLDDNIAEWKYVLGGDRVLIVSKTVLDLAHEISAKKMLRHIDLLDVFIDVSNGTQVIKEQVTNALSGLLDTKELGPWIQWTLGGVSEQRMSRGVIANTTLAATLMQLMLPGTPSIFYGDEISLEESHDLHNEHSDTKHLHHLSPMVWNNSRQFTSREMPPWLPFGASVALHNFNEIKKMITLRDESPSIYQNAIAKGEIFTSNTNIKLRPNNILIVERSYPRRNTYVSITNLGVITACMDLSSIFYSGEPMIGNVADDKVYFNKFEIRSMETIVVKLDK